MTGAGGLRPTRFLLPVGVHLKSTLKSVWPGHRIHLHLISMTTFQQPVFLSTDPILIALFMLAAIEINFLLHLMLAIKELVQKPIALLLANK